MTSNLFDLSGRVALITGASRGIARAIAQGLAEAGVSIALSSRTQADLFQAAEEIHALVRHLLARRGRWLCTVPRGEFFR